MTENEIRDYKKKLMKEHWVEERHRQLKELSMDDAKIIVESMNEREVYLNVNVRHTQEDYIADYLEFLWKISPAAFWKHMLISLDANEGVLWGGDMPHFEKMCRQKIPNEVWDAVLKFIFESDGKFEQDLEAIGCVVKAQAEKYGRMLEIESFIASLSDTSQEIVSARINKMLNSPCKYYFG